MKVIIPLKDDLKQKHVEIVLSWNILQDIVSKRKNAENLDNLLRTVSFAVGCVIAHLMKP